ncbi:MAG: HAMP domain-containing sensor histidine kinase [Candidatus Latescibacter sp.]|nr:HAMP domain-containing sensor histidine kinase [Candidatus Latescibacter sp.]
MISSGIVLLESDRETAHGDFVFDPSRLVIEAGGVTHSRERIRTEAEIFMAAMSRRDKKNTKTILVIDDEEVMHDSCAQVLSRQGYSIVTAYEGEEGLKKVLTAHPDLVLFDMKLAGKNGINILRNILDIDPTIVIVVITGHATIESAVEAMKHGASDFLPKPFTPDELRLIVSRGMEKRDLLLQTRKLREENWRIRENFVSIITHEMRSPLVAVEEYIEVLLAGICGRMEEKQIAVLSRCKCRIMWLLSLVNEWLSMARIQETTIFENLEEVDIRNVLFESFDLMNVQAEEKNITVTFDIPAGISPITGNSAALVLLFMNLYSNAIKYNKKFGSIAIKVYDKGDALSISISDTGIGIPQESLPFIFDEFFRVRTQGKEEVSTETGTGLGLAIVKRIVEVHKGYINVESTPGIGSCFTVHLPKKQDASAEPDDEDKS